MNTEQLLGLATGIIFGFLLQRSGVVRFEKQIGMLLFKDMTVLRFTLTAIIVGMAGIIILAQVGILTLNHKPMNVAAIYLGASLFGAGWALTGLCPGTAMGALGEGRLHAAFTIAGMLVGAMLYARTYDFLDKTMLAGKDYGQISWPDVTDTPVFILVGLFAIGGILLMRTFDKKGL